MHKATTIIKSTQTLYSSIVFTFTLSGQSSMTAASAEPGVIQRTVI